jgi:hypothetical protein
MLDVATYMIDRHRYKTLHLTKKPSASLPCASAPVCLSFAYMTGVLRAYLRDILLGSHHYEVLLYNPLSQCGNFSSSSSYSLIWPFLIPGQEGLLLQPRGIRSCDNVRYADCLDTCMYPRSTTQLGFRTLRLV